MYVVSGMFGLGGGGTIRCWYGSDVTKGWWVSIGMWNAMLSARNVYVQRKDTAGPESRRCQGARDAFPPSNPAA